MQEPEVGVRAAEVSKIFYFVLFFLLTAPYSKMLVPGVQERKNKVRDDEGGVTERSGGDGEAVREAEGGGG